MFQKCIATVTALTLGILGISFLTVHGKSIYVPDREADKQALDKLIKSSTQAFNNRDAAGMAANWTAEGEYILNDGDPIRGWPTSRRDMRISSRPSRASPLSTCRLTTFDSRPMTQPFPKSPCD